MIETISFWMMPYGSLKKRIRKCNCGERLTTPATECKLCHKIRMLKKRKKRNYERYKSSDNQRSENIYPRK